MTLNLIDIRTTAGRYGFVDAGVAPALPVELEEQRRFLSILEDGCFADMDYLSRNVEKRLDPRKLFDGARSILCFLAPYGRKGASVASFALGKDYHKVVKDKLFAIIEELKLLRGGFNGRPFTDSAPVLERYWARKAGLGFIGLNNFLISPDYGLRTVIGVIVCNVAPEEFLPHPPLEVEECGRCGSCFEACPSKALGWSICSGQGTGAAGAPGAGIVTTAGDTSAVRGESAVETAAGIGTEKKKVRDDCKDNHLIHRLDARKCISYHTIESKSLTLPHPTDCCGSIFGCERCLAACPWDKDIPSWPEFETNAEAIAHENWMEMSEIDFKKKYGGTGLMRTGLEKIKNNIR